MFFIQNYQPVLQHDFKFTNSYFNIRQILLYLIFLPIISKIKNEFNFES